MFNKEKLNWLNLSCLGLMNMSLHIEFIHPVLQHTWSRVWQQAAWKNPQRYLAAASCRRTKRLTSPSFLWCCHQQQIRGTSQQKHHETERSIRGVHMEAAGAHTVKLYNTRPAEGFINSPQYRQCGCIRGSSPISLLLCNWFTASLQSQPTHTCSTHSDEINSPNATNNEN